jgi:hypothetical protein
VELSNALRIHVVPHAVAVARDVHEVAVMHEPVRFRSESASDSLDDFHWADEDPRHLSAGVLPRLEHATGLHRRTQQTFPAVGSHGAGCWTTDASR